MGDHNFKILFTAIVDIDEKNIFFGSKSYSPSCTYLRSWYTGAELPIYAFFDIRALNISCSTPYRHTRSQINTETHTHMKPHSQEHTRTHARTQTLHAHADTHKHAHTNTPKHTQAHTNTHKHTQTHTHRNTHTDTYAHGQTLTQTERETRSDGHGGCMCLPSRRMHVFTVPADARVDYLGGYTCIPSRRE